MYWTWIVPGGLMRGFYSQIFYLLQCIRPGAGGARIKKGSNLTPKQMLLVGGLVGSALLQFRRPVGAQQEKGSG